MKSPNILHILLASSLLQGAFTLHAQMGQLPDGPRLKSLVGRSDTQVVYQGGILNDYPTNYTAFADTTNYQLVAGREFNLLSNENSMKWKIFQPSEGSFQYSVPDQVVQFAADHGANFHGHMLVGGHRTYIPDWVYTKTTSTDVLNAMYAEIDALATRYRTSAGHPPVQVWEVVNEAMDPHDSWPANSDWTKGLRTGEAVQVYQNVDDCHSTAGYVNNSNYDIFVDKIGPSYIEKAFRRAHADSPDAQLIYNDSGNGAPAANSGTAARLEYIYEMAQDFVNPSRSGGAVPINGIGFQAHMGGTTDYGLERTNFQRFSDLGVDVYITEMDDSVSGSSDLVTNNIILDKQARLYHNYLDAALRVPSFRSMQVWGINDAHTYHYNANPNACSSGNPMPEPLLFDTDSNPKPAYYAVQDALSTQYRLEATSNNGFESGVVSPWVPRNGGTLSIATSGAHSGSYAVEITGRTVPNSGPSQDVTSMITSQGAGKYFLRGWLKVPSGSTTAKLTLRIEDSTGVNFYSTPVSTVTTGWTEVSGWVPVKWTKILTSVVLYAETTGTGAPNFYVDDVTLSDGTLLANGRFENGTAGWGVNFGGTIAATDDSTDNSAGYTTYMYGAAGVQVTDRSQPYHGVSQDITAELLAAGKGTFALSGMMKLFPGSASVTGEIRLRLKYDGTNHYYSVTAPVGADKWYRINGTVDLDWTTLESAVLYVDTTSGTSSYYADDLVIRRPFSVN